MQKQHVVVHLAHCHIEIAHAIEILRELSQLVIVRCKYCLASGVIMEVLAHGPRDRDAVIGGRAASDLVEQNETPHRRRVQDGTRLRHFDHECRLPAHEVVARSNANEEAVDESDAR